MRAAANESGTLHVENARRVLQQLLGRANDLQVRRLRLLCLDDRTGPGTPIHNTHFTQDSQCLAHRVAAHQVLLRQLGLRRQRIAHSELSRFNLRKQLVYNLPVEHGRSLIDSP